MATKRAFILPMLLLLAPIIVLTVFTLVQMAVVENGFALQQMQEKKLFYLAESGLNVGYYAFAAGNFTRVTHASDGVTPVSGPNLLTVSIPGIQYDSTSGWYQWKWSPGDPPDQSFTGDGLAESYRFQVYFPSATDPTLFKVVCQSTLGNHTATHTMQGFATNMFQYVLYGNGDVSDFSRYASATWPGRVQVNGNAWFCPMLAGTTLNLQSDLIDVGGSAYRYEDIWGNADGGGDVYVSKGGQGGSPTVMDGTSQGDSGPGEAFDSFNAAWPLASAAGSIQVFGGTIVDGTTGGQKLQAPSPALVPGGFFDQIAGLHVTAATVKPWVTPETFLNYATQLRVTAPRLDLAQLGMSADWPANGILYANTPIVLYHGEQLRGPLTIVSNCTVYVRGSYNRNYDNLVAQLLYILLGISTRQPAAIVTSDRIFLLSDAWSDAGSLGGSVLTGLVLPEYLGDLNELFQVWELNVALADGAPPVDMVNYVPSWQGTVNPGFHPSGDPHTGRFLENLGSVTVQMAGATAHLENATMAAFDNSNAGPGVTPWIVQQPPLPPRITLSWDPTLLSSPPPGVPRVASRTAWQRTTP